MSFFLCRCAPLYPSPRQTTHVPLRFCKFKKKKKKRTRGNMGKDIKSYATIPFSRKGREASRQNIPVHWPNKT